MNKYTFISEKSWKAQQSALHPFLVEVGYFDTTVCLCLFTTTTADVQIITLN